MTTAGGCCRAATRARPTRAAARAGIGDRQMALQGPGLRAWAPGRPAARARPPRRPCVDGSEKRKRLAGRAAAELLSSGLPGAAARAAEREPAGAAPAGCRRGLGGAVQEPGNSRRRERAQAGARRLLPPPPLPPTTTAPRASLPCRPRPQTPSPRGWRAPSPSCAPVCSAPGAACAPCSCAALSCTCRACSRA